MVSKWTERPKNGLQAFSAAVGATDISLSKLRQVFEGTATDLNGTTNNDRTNYFQNVPKTALDTVLWLESDRMGRPLPQWEGCESLGAGEFFLLMADAPDSFDGRYFGVIQRHDIIGRLVALWTR